MRNVLQRVKILIMSRDFNSAFPPRRTVKVPSARIVENPAINREMVVVKAFIHRSRRRAHPSAVLRFLKFGAAASAQAQTHCDTLGVGCHDAERNFVIGADSCGTVRSAGS